MTKKQPEKKAKSASTGSHRTVAGATLASILGTASPGQKRNGEVKIRPEWEKYRKILLDLRERLTNQMSGLAKESAEEMSSYSLHMADSGTDNFDRDFALVREEAQRR